MIVLNERGHRPEEIRVLSDDAVLWAITAVNAVSLAAALHSLWPAVKMLIQV